MRRRGFFLALEGVEGAGKTTQARRLSRWMGVRGIAHHLAREPGGTRVGEAIRSLLLDAREVEIPDETELLLLLAARAAFVRGVVQPALERGVVVVADRFELSTMAYQGRGRGLGLEAVRALNAFATGGIRPDLTLVFDLPVSGGLARQAGAGKPQDRIEREGAQWLETVREAYRMLAAGDDTVRVIDADQTRDRVERAVRDILETEHPESFRGCRG